MIILCPDCTGTISAHHPECRHAPVASVPCENEARPMSLRDDINAAINRHSREKASDTPDFILAEYIMGCLDAFDQAVRSREKWYGRRDFV